MRRGGASHHTPISTRGGGGGGGAAGGAAAAAAAAAAAVDASSMFTTPGTPFPISYAPRAIGGGGGAAGGAPGSSLGYYGYGMSGGGGGGGARSATTHAAKFTPGATPASVVSKVPLPEFLKQVMALPLPSPAAAAASLSSPASAVADIASGGGGGGAAAAAAAVASPKASCSEAIVEALKLLLITKSTEESSNELYNLLTGNPALLNAEIDTDGHTIVHAVLTKKDNGFIAATFAAAAACDVKLDAFEKDYFSVFPKYKCLSSENINSAQKIDSSNIHHRLSHLVRGAHLDENAALAVAAFNCHKYGVSSLSEHVSSKYALTMLKANHKAQAAFAYLVEKGLSSGNTKVSSYCKEFVTHIDAAEGGDDTARRLDYEATPVATPKLAPAPAPTPEADTVLADLAPPPPPPAAAAAPAPAPTPEADTVLADLAPPPSPPAAAHEDAPLSVGVGASARHAVRHPSAIVSPMHIGRGLVPHGLPESHTPPAATGRIDTVVGALGSAVYVVDAALTRLGLWMRGDGPTSHAAEPDGTEGVHHDHPHDDHKPGLVGESDHHDAL